MNMETIQQNLDALLHNHSEQNRLYYEMFFDPEPNDVEMQVYVDGALTTVTIPNRAKMAEWYQSSVERYQGDVTIYNRGVVTGCAVTKSTTATRNLNLSAGVIFAHGRQYACSELLNTASVPTNSGDSAAMAYVYLYLDDDGTIKCNCTELGAPVPDNGIAVALLTVPAGSTEAADAYLSTVGLTDIRRIEANWPLCAGSPVPVYVTFPAALDATDYHVALQVLDCEGGRMQIGEVFAADQLVNGFKVYATGSADAIQVRYYINAEIGDDA